MGIKRRALLLVLLCGFGTVIGVAVSGQYDSQSDVVSPVEKNITPNFANSNQGEAGSNTARYDLSLIKRSMPESIQSGGLFGSKSWYSSPPLPPSVPVSALPSTQPSAPPLAFTFLGRMIDRGEVIVFLSKGGHHYTAKLNDVLDNIYRVEKISTTNVELTYIPLNIRQTLAFNSTAIGSSALNDILSAVSTESLSSAQQFSLIH